MRVGVMARTRPDDHREAHARVIVAHSRALHATRADHELWIDRQPRQEVNADIVVAGAA